MIAVLTGSKAKEVTERNLHQVPTHGALAGEPAAYLRGVFDELVRAGVIALGPAPYHVASLTPRGRDVVWRRASVSLRWPTLEGTAAILPNPNRGSVPHGRRPSAGKRRHVVAEPIMDRALTVSEEVLFDKLKEWRKEEANEQGTPAFTVFNNRTLKAIAIAKPDTLAALENVPGIGPAKLEAYGDAILTLLDRMNR